MSAEPRDVFPLDSLQPWADTLIDVAESALDHGLAHGDPPTIDPAGHPEPLRARRAVFVTLRDHAGELRGGVGSIGAHRPLVVDVALNAFAAAFLDPRFWPLTHAERPHVRCELLVAGKHRSTLLPQVWEHIPDPRDFWRAVKQKAGLAADALPPDLAVYRYQTERLHNPAGRADGIEAGIRPERPSRAKWENECGFSIV